MTENQIYKRMNFCYKTEYGERDEDEWYGENDSKIWHFHRPSQAVNVKLILKEDEKRVEFYEMKDSNFKQGYQKIGSYRFGY